LHSEPVSPNGARCPLCWSSCPAGSLRAQILLPPSADVERKIFTERLPELVGPWAKMTIRYCQQLTSVGLATCGKGGTRLAARLGMQTSRQTILRHIMDLPDPPVGAILYLGIDDFCATRSYMCSCKDS